MLGRQHLMLSVATISVLLIPYIQQAELLVLTAFLGTAVGSLIPDIDAQDAAIFHRDVKGLNKGFSGAINRFIGPMLPFFGYSTKYLIYLPVVKIFNLFSRYSFQSKHRTFSHSILGVLTITALTGIYLTPVLLYFDIYSTLYLGVFLTSYMIGAFLHLLQDSCTKTGIAWNSPFSKTKIKGKLTTGKDKTKPRIFLYYLGTLSAATLLLTHTGQLAVTLQKLTVLSTLTLALSWIVFTKIVAGAKIHR